MLNNDFFNSFIGVYRPYIKLTQPILDKHDIHTGQWLVLRDIANFQPTTLVKISHRRSIENLQLVKLLRSYLKIIGLLLLKVMTKEKLLSLTPVGKALFDAINEEVTVVQENIIKK